MNRDKIDVSIILACYNAESFVAENVKQIQDVMDATKYFMLSGRDLMVTRPMDAKPADELQWPYTRNQGSTGWMAG